MVCAGCGYRLWPCASCGVPRCMCRAGDIYQHHYPVPKQEPVIVAFKCGHTGERWNTTTKGKCRECHNAYNRAYMRAYMRGKRAQ